MSDRWTWVIRYAVVIVLSLILAWGLGEMTLFKGTRIGKTGLNAARLVQFFGSDGALFLFSLLPRRAAYLLPGGDARWAVARSILLPVATLIVVAGAHDVLLLVLAPLMRKAWLQAY